MTKEIFEAPVVTLGKFISEVEITRNGGSEKAVLLGRLKRVEAQFGPHINLGEDICDVLKQMALGCSEKEWQDLFPQIVFGQGRGSTHCSEASISKKRRHLLQGKPKAGHFGTGRNNRSR